MECCKNAEKKRQSRIYIVKVQTAKSLFSFLIDMAKSEASALRPRFLGNEKSHTRSGLDGDSAKKKKKGKPDPIKLQGIVYRVEPAAPNSPSKT